MKKYLSICIALMMFGGCASTPDDSDFDRYKTAVKKGHVHPDTTWADWEAGLE